MNKKLLTPHKSANHAINRLIAFLMLLYAALGHAGALSTCPIIDATYPDAQYKPVQDMRVQLMVNFKMEQSDLVIIEKDGTGQATHQITFGAAKKMIQPENCPLVPLALVRGGDWGWHVLWQSAKGVFYARVDGEAWVSSVPKKLTASPATDILMHVSEQRVVVRWREFQADDVIDKQAISSDEGRSWDE